MEISYNVGDKGKEKRKGVRGERSQVEEPPEDDDDCVRQTKQKRAHGIKREEERPHVCVGVCVCEMDEFKRKSESRLNYN